MLKWQSKILKSAKYRSYQFDTLMETNTQMSNTSGEMLVEMWLAVKPYIDKKERDDAAVSFLRAAEDFVDLEQAQEDADGSDSALDKAFAEIVGDLETYDEDEDLDDEAY